MRRTAPAKISARLRRHVALDVHANGEIVAYFNGYSVGLGAFGPGAANRAKTLRMGLPLASVESGGADQQIDRAPDPANGCARIIGI